jgi:NAD+ synthase
MRIFEKIDVKKELLNIDNWIKEYFAKNGPEAKAVIGISGGKDSTIAAMMLVKALGKDRVVGIKMPNGVQKDIRDANTVCDVLGIKSYTIDISDICSEFYETFDAFANEDRDSSTEINTPPRVRMTILYMMAATIGGRVVNTSNASESYVGYCTKFGDLAGDLALLKNYYVREVIAMGEELLKEFPEMPSTLIDKAPADGLTGLTDEEKLGFSYEELDSMILDKVYPSAEKVALIKAKHEMARHKLSCICIPGPYPERNDGKWSF